MADFSSTQKTAACCGGFTYSAMMSAAFSSNCGSLLAMYRSSRWGLSLACASTRCTLVLLRPSVAASLRHGLGVAITYLLKHWDRLTLFLRQPGAPLDNNIVACGCTHL